MSGRKVSLVDPQPEDIYLPDIMGHLRGIRRFNGSIPWTVLEHSVLVWLLDSTPESLMHDAHEAYMGDITTPVGDALGPAVVEMKQRLQAAINAKFGLRTYDCSQADRRALEIEVGTLMRPAQARLFARQEINPTAVQYVGWLGVRPFRYYWG